MLTDVPLRLTVVKCPNQCGFDTQMPDEHPEFPGGKGAAVEVEQVNSVFTLQVGLYLVAVLVE
jgi:hypothetical protein